MKKNLFWKLLSLIILIFSLYSCRTEDLLQDEQNGEQKYKVSILNKEQIKRETTLLKELSGIKSKFRYKANINGKAIQNEVLDGAIIGINQVLLIENNGIKTYTFPVSRTYLSNKSENLVVKENTDHTFSGVLIQYDLTKEQQQKFISGEITDIKSKIKIYDIDKLNLTSRVQTDQVGCYIITWETGWCSAGVHQTGSDNTCTVGGAPAPTILSIEDTCNQDSGGGNGTGDGGLGGIGTGGEPIDLGGFYTTLPFVSLGYQYYETEDLSDPNYINYLNTANYFISLGDTLNQLRVTNPDIFYYTYFYFKNNGINIPTKKFITERLTGLNAWYEKVNSNPNLSPMNNQYFLNWAFQYLVQNPDVTWQEFYDEYLATPCDNIKAKFADTKFKEKVTAIDKPEVFDYDHEMGYAAGYPPPNTGITETQYPPMENTLGTHNVKLPDGNQYFGYMHSHNNESNNGTPIKIFSPADLITFLTSCVRNADEHGSIKDAYCMVITSEGNYILQYTGTGDYSVGSNQIKNWKKWYSDQYETLAKEDELTQINVEKTFVRFLNESVKINGLEVYHVEKITGKASKINADGTKTPCP